MSKIVDAKTGEITETGAKPPVETVVPAPDPQAFDYEPPEPPDFSPFGALGRFLRGRKRWICLLTLLLAPPLGYLGFTNGTKTYETQAIIRVYPQQAGILYDTGDDSVLKTFEAYVKAETTYVASFPVMDRAFDKLAAKYPAFAEEATVSDLTGAIEIRRRESLITMKTAAKSPEMVRDMLQAVADAYLELRAENDIGRSALRLRELEVREQELLAEIQEMNQRTLEVGGEFGVDSLAKAHIEKVGQIDSLLARQAEVQATLESMLSAEASSADMSDQEIMRATLLDRALADLNFDKAKREAELETLLLRYNESAPIVTDKKNQIAIIDQAMAERREQIKVLGQTGALTDTSNNSPEDNIAEIEALLGKVQEQVARARGEARDLNAKRIELGFLAQESEELRDLLDETRRALEVLRLESGKDLPGLSVLMAPPVAPEKPADDSAKVLAAGGVAGGGFLALLIVIIAGMMNDKLRYSDDLWRTGHLVPILRVVSRKNTKKADRFRREIERLRNDIMLLPARSMPVAGRARIISVVATGPRSPADTALELARSFARTQLSTILVDADLLDDKLSKSLDLADKPGWADVLKGKEGELEQVTDPEMRILPHGTADMRDDGAIAITAIRRAMLPLAHEADVIIINGGSLSESLSAELLLSASDLAIGVSARGETKTGLADRVTRLDELPRNGGALLFTMARKGDPGLA